MYGDLGRLPLSVFRKLRIIKYWIRIVENYDSNSLLCKTYNMMYQEVIQGRANINVSYNWAAQIKHILDELGFTYRYVWNNQFDVLPNFLSISRELLTNTCNYGLLILMNLANWTGIGFSRIIFLYKQKHILTVLTIVNLEMPYVNLDCQHTVLK